MLCSFIHVNNGNDDDDAHETCPCLLQALEYCTGVQSIVSHLRLHADRATLNGTWPFPEMHPDKEDREGRPLFVDHVGQAGIFNSIARVDYIHGSVDSIP